MYCDIPYTLEKYEAIVFGMILPKRLYPLGGDTVIKKTVVRIPTRLDSERASRKYDIDGPRNKMWMTEYSGQRHRGKHS